MALITSADGLVTAKTTIQTFQGIMELEFLDLGVTRKVIVNSNKMANEPFTMQTGSGISLQGFRLLGNAYAFTQPTVDGDAARVITSFTTEGPQGIRTIRNGVGKVDVDTDDVLKNIKNVDFLIGNALDAPLDSLSIEQGAVLFISTTATATEVAIRTIPTSGATTISGGTGTAILTSSGIERVVRLDETTYPFNVVATETLTPVGSSVVLV